MLLASRRKASCSDEEALGEKYIALSKQEATLCGDFDRALDSVHLKKDSNNPTHEPGSTATVSV